MAITKLNGRWLSRQFRHLDPPNNDNTKVPLAVSALQHIPFKIDVSRPPFQSTDDNAKEEYWNTLDSAATDTRQWSIPVIMNIFWALVALSFTIVGSLVAFQEVISIPGDVGYPIVAVWSYLLPLVVGWFYVGSQLKANQLRDALSNAYEKAFLGPAKQPDPTKQFDLATQPDLTTQPDLAKYPDPVKQPDPVDNTSEPSKGIEYSIELIDHDVNADEKKTAPIFNYARVFVWSQYAEQILNLYPRANRREGRSRNIVSRRVLWAAIFAHLLQWGTTGASILIHFFTPPKGFGCRALTYVVYGSAGTFSFWLLLLSSILAHKTRPKAGPQTPLPSSTRFVGYIAILMRWFGKTIAVANGLGILIACGMQFAGLYDNCFCSSTLFGGSPDGLVKFLEPNIKGSQVYGYWIGGLIFAFGTSFLYGIMLYVVTPMEV